MRKTQVALAALALVASSAALADVTVSGYMDVGVGNVTTQGTKMVGGLLAPNMFNVAGSEDLGNGMKAEFLLQNRFDVPNGTTVGGLGIWNQSYIGLSTEVGTVQIGKAVDSFWGTAAAFDVTGGGNMGSYVDAILFTGSSAVFGQDQIKYISPNLGGLNVQASYYTGGATSTKNDYSVGGVYNLGGLTIGGGYANRTDVLDATTNASTRSGNAYHLGAGYDFGIAKVNVVYTDTNKLGSAYGVNAAVPVPSIAALTLTAGYYSISSTNANNGSSTSIGAKYALSKRTTLFANYQTASDNYKVLFGTSQDKNLMVGGANAIVVGVGHAF